MFEVHFLYPLWLFFIPVGLLALYGFYRFHSYQQRSRKGWNELVDKSLQPFVVSGSGSKKSNSRSRIILYALIGLFAILALSGPSLHKQKVPLYETHQGLVVALDLSSSMLSHDIKPSRIQRAKLVLIDLLKPNLAKGTRSSSSPSSKYSSGYSGYVGLLVFAGSAFAVSPLTNDVDTIFAQLTHMSPEIMPSQGSRLDKAINQSVGMLVNAGYKKGKILLITDGLSDVGRAKAAARKATIKGFEVSVLAVGTVAGATIPYRHPNSKSKALLNKQGKPIIARLDVDALKDVVSSGEGVFLDLNTDNNVADTLLTRYQPDIQIKPSDATKSDTNQNNINQRVIEYWKNAGIWLLFPLLFMVLYLFRRGLVWVLCFIVLFPVDPVYAFNWNNLLLNQEQQAKQLLDKGEAVKAQELFSQQEWKATAAYRAKNYALAVKLFSRENTIKSWFNRGNSYLMQGKWVEAQQAFQIVLEKQPKHEDARYNLQLVEVALQRQSSLANTEPEENPILQENASSEEFSQQDVNQMLDSLPELTNEFSTQLKEQQSYEKQWLKSVPDDPSGLWRRKFKYQYQKRSQQSEAQPW